MDSIKSFKGYGKVDELEDRAFKQKSRKRLIFIVLGLVALAAIVALTAVVVITKHNSNSGDSKSSPTTPASSIKAVCEVTQYPDSCFRSISALEGPEPKTTDPEGIFKLSLQVAISELKKLTSLPKILISKYNDEATKQALEVCQIVFDDAVITLNDSITAVDNGGKLTDMIGDLRTWLSSAITYQETCLDTLKELNSTSAPTLYNEVGDFINNSTQFASNSLAIVTKILGILSNFNIPTRRLLGESEFPMWVSAGDRRLLQAANLKPDVTVAADGSGDVRTIKDAVAKIVKKSETRFVIYVKAGKYLENIILDKSMWNVMIYGDGKNKTIVSGSLNNVDGTPTFASATFAAVGKGFIAKDMTFMNTAGPQKHQAVAIRSGSDMSVFYRCSFDAFQDTLYAHSNRQFYRDCDITGTVDFIFGNAAAVFQNCSIQPRQPMANQFVTITAQGKSDPNQNTGFSIQKCTMTPLDNLTVSSYLGRPWKNYSTTVVMQTNIGSFLQPMGWIEWVSNVLPPSTIFYAEYENTGPGSSVDKRVTWAGYKPSLTQDQALKYTVQSFIQGDHWLNGTNVVFDLSL